jgi:hypothetical protein
VGKERFSSVEDEKHPFSRSGDVAELVTGQAGDALRSLATDHPVRSAGRNDAFSFRPGAKLPDAISTSVPGTAQ